MGFWTEPDNAKAEKLPPGTHNVAVTKVMRGSRSKESFETANGDRQIMVIFEDSTGREASQMICVEGRAAFRLRQMVKCLGLDVAKMDQHGVNSERFADEDFARKQLLNRKGRIVVKHKDGSDFADVEFLWDESKMPPAADPHQPMDPETIPF